MSKRSRRLVALAWAAVLLVGPAVVQARPPRFFVATNSCDVAQLNRLESFHTNFYRVAQGAVERADGWFAKEGIERRPTPPSRFRLGVFGKFRLNAQDIARIEPVVDFDAKVKLPNANNRLRLFITTTDPAALPGSDILERDTSLRIGARRQWVKAFNLSSGLRLRQTPEAFVNASWSKPFPAGPWKFYPQQKFYAQSDDGAGEITSLVVDHWLNRWNFRQSLSLKWSFKDERDDARGAEDVDGVQFGQDGQGWRWEYVTLFNYVMELMDEPDPWRLVGGRDLANSTGVKAIVVGDPDETRQVRVALTRKVPLRKQWLFLLLSPEVSWSDDDHWRREILVKLGVEAIFWGTPER